MNTYHLELFLSVTPKHPDYIENVPGIPYDIALIRLVNPVDISDHYIRTACLPLSNLTNDDYSHFDCYISGWGSTKGNPYHVRNSSVLYVIT